MENLKGDKFYVASYHNFGFNPTQSNRFPEYEVVISTQPFHGNSGDKPVITEGWLGTTNDIYGEAHGEFDNYSDALKQARDVMNDIDKKYWEEDEFSARDYDGNAEVYVYTCEYWDIADWVTNDDFKSIVENAESFNDVIRYINDVLLSAETEDVTLVGDISKYYMSEVDHYWCDEDTVLGMDFSTFKEMLEKEVEKLVDKYQI